MVLFLASTYLGFLIATISGGIFSWQMSRHITRQQRRFDHRIPMSQRMRISHPQGPGTRWKVKLRDIVVIVTIVSGVVFIIGAITSIGMSACPSPVF